jgi:uncharacterized protein YrzB (UPF0473 family)
MTEQNEMITLVDEEGQEHSFTLLDILNVNDKEYAILLPTDPGFIDSEADGQEAIIFRIVETEEEHTLLAVEDEAEWEAVAKAWEEMELSDDDYEEEDEEEDEGI